VTFTIISDTSKMTDNYEKKRKRNSEKEGRPKKKVAIETSPASTFKFSVVADEGEWSPVLGALNSATEQL
jgi:hypothetical protein